MFADQSPKLETRMPTPGIFGEPPQAKADVEEDL